MKDATPMVHIGDLYFQTKNNIQSMFPKDQKDMTIRIPTEYASWLPW